uniref:Uncharacterized protein n=1 Tax=Corethron hystrix TaxID=216773 RepID=A0A7S1BAQ1_9STRA|mmetsp:Transcript_19434/g.44266  ORF Transcript_19434/g.44266 Transcript_19434/m.44266 type:complete len:138 (+) Transcript_19434:503-916(+)
MLTTCVLCAPLAADDKAGTGVEAGCGSIDEARSIEEHAINAGVRKQDSGDVVAAAVRGAAAPQCDKDEGTGMYQRALTKLSYPSACNLQAVVNIYEWHGTQLIPKDAKITCTSVVIFRIHSSIAMTALTKPLSWKEA